MKPSRSLSRKRQYASQRGFKTGSEKPPEPLRQIPNHHRSAPDVKKSQKLSEGSRKQLLNAQYSEGEFEQEFKVEREEFVSRRNEERRKIAKARWGEITLPSFLKILPRWYTYTKVVELKPATSAICDDWYLRDRHIIQLKIAFDQIDVDESGKIDIWEFLNFLKEPRTLFTEKFFGLIDLNGDGDLSFDEFIQAIVGNCVMTRKDILELCFDMFDKDHSGSIEGKEYVDMAICFRENDSGFGGNLMNVIKNFDEDDDGTIDLQEFIALDEKFPMLLYPAFRMQQHMQRKTLGSRTWLRILKHKEYMKKSAEYAKKTNGLPLPETKLESIRRLFFGPPWKDFDGVKERIGLGSDDDIGLKTRTIVPAHAAKAERSIVTTVKKYTMKASLALLGVLNSLAFCTHCKSKDYVIQPGRNEVTSLAEDSVESSVVEVTHADILTKNSAKLVKANSIPDPVERVLAKSVIRQTPSFGSQLIMKRLKQPSAAHLLTMTKSGLTVESQDDDLTCSSCGALVPRKRMGTHQTFCSVSRKQYRPSTLAKIRQTERPKTAAVHNLQEKQRPHSANTKGRTGKRPQTAAVSRCYSERRPNTAGSAKSGRSKTNRIKRAKSARTKRPNTAGAPDVKRPISGQAKVHHEVLLEDKQVQRRPKTSRHGAPSTKETQLTVELDFASQDEDEGHQLDILVLPDGPGEHEFEVHSMKSPKMFAPTPKGSRGDSDVVQFFDKQMNNDKYGSLKPINLKIERNKYRVKPM